MKKILTGIFFYDLVFYTWTFKIDFFILLEVYAFDGSLY